MRMLEVFSGSGRMASAFRAKGWKTMTIDLTCPADLNQDARTLTRQKEVTFVKVLTKEIGGKEMTYLKVLTREVGGKRR